MQLKDLASAITKEETLTDIEIVKPKPDKEEVQKHTNGPYAGYNWRNNTKKSGAGL